MSILEKNNHILNVYIWNTVYLSGEAGHVSIALNKIDEHGQLVKNRHFGFWPRREFTVLDVPFHIGAMEKTSLADEVNYSEQNPPWKPDKLYQIKINDQQFIEMEYAIQQHSKNITSDKTRYTWLTSVNNLFYYAAGYQLNLENCSTIATKIMNAGGIPIHNNSMLWGISPIDVSHQLNALITQNIISGTCISGSM